VYLNQVIWLDLDTPIINAIIPSNQQQVEKGIKMITEKGNKKIGILGFSFKAGTDDLRESPLVEVIERLLGKGYDIRLYDKNVNIATLVGANKDYIMNQIPHISKLMVQSINEIMAHADTIVIGNGADEFKDILEQTRDNQVVVDLVRITDRISDKGYDGICW
jgi:GDP-mannose 6-dehydrogenase